MWKPLLCLFTLTAAAASAETPRQVAALLDRHCLECHDSDVKKGGLDLQSLPFTPADPANFKAWQRIYDRVRDGEMPPAKKPEPERAEAAAFLAALHSPLQTADREDIAANGRVRGRRLTRVEYENTLHDLLGIDIPLKDLLPEDGVSHGFFTVAEGQQLSHHQLARYLDVADLALNEAFSRALGGDKRYKAFHTPEDLARMTRGNYRGPDLRNGESISWPIGLQFFGRMRATQVPEDGWYRITLRGVRAINPDTTGAVWGTLRSGTCYSDAPMLFMIGLVEAALEPRDLVYEAWIQKDHMLELRPNDGTLKRAATGAKGGNVSFEDRDLEKDGFAGIAHRGIDIERIYPSAGHAAVKQILFGQVDPRKPKGKKAAVLDDLVVRFARQAFRRPVTEAQVAPYQDIGRRSLAQGDSLTEALRASYRAILCSPRFLTFIEVPGTLDSHAVASRLSYALWMSQPDRALLALAEEDRLRDPEILTAQIHRMLKDPKAERFVRGFTDQWLKLKEIDFTSPDTRQFPQFDPVVQESMLQETRAYFAELIRSDLAVSHFIDSDFTYLNSRLAKHYSADAAPTAGQGLQKVALTRNTAGIRGGLITQGAVLKVTADGTSTSPVVRGVFINERILGRHIPPPPPGVPAIEPDMRGATSIRDQLEKHRSNESCASCHRTIDPPGFALESFDPVGGWRTRYGKGDKKAAAVDPSGQTPDGETFADLMGWKSIYSRRSAMIAEGFARQFLTYATGAPIRFSDEAAIGEIVEESAKSGHGLRSLISACLRSDTFLQK
jgi:hypothetical protein